jgi:transcriptional regulator with XRE-family HTH domain
MAPNPTVSSVVFTVGETNPATMSAEEFRRCRTVIPMTAEQLASFLGVTRMTIWRYEHGRTPIPDEIARYVRDASAPLTERDLALMDRSA